MSQLNYRNRSYIAAKDPRLLEALDDISTGLANVAQQTTARLVGATSAPPQIGSITVTAADGIFDIAIFDNSPVFRGINYFADYSTDPSFVSRTVLDMGTSRNFRIYLGNLALYWRGYSAYPTSASSVPVNFGAPDAVVGGGSAGPTQNPSYGSGTSLSSDQDGSGFGSDPSRGSPTQQ